MFTTEHLYELLQDAAQYGREHGYDNGGTVFIGIKPTEEYPVVSAEMWMHTTRDYYTVVYLLSDDMMEHTFLDAHICNSWAERYTRCEKCETLREANKK